MCSQIVLIRYSAYKERMYKTTTQLRSFVTLNSNIRWKIFNRNNVRIVFQKLVWCVTELEGLTITNNELYGFSKMMVYEQMKRLSSGMQIKQPKLTTDSNLKWIHFTSFQLIHFLNYYLSQSCEVWVKFTPKDKILVPTKNLCKTAGTDVSKSHQTLLQLLKGICLLLMKVCRPLS